MIISLIRGAATALKELLLPRYCIVCDRMLGQGEEHLCLDCDGDLPHTYFWQAGHNPMADRFNAGIEDYRLRESSSKEYERYAFAMALFFYRDGSGYREILHHIKYMYDIQAGEEFGRRLASKVAIAEYLNDVDTVIPVPLHRSRQHSRGYNQAEIIAKEIAATLGVPLRKDILKRRRKTKTQTKLNDSQKRKNVDGAFSVCKRLCTEKCKDCGIRHILLVDDVFTTGSTVLACFVALRSVFPPSVRISVATLAFVGEV